MLFRKKLKQNERECWIYWRCYLSEGALGEANLANSPDGYCNYGGEGYGPAQIVGPVWIHIVTKFQGLIVHKGTDEANLKEKYTQKVKHFWTDIHEHEYMNLCII